MECGALKVTANHFAGIIRELRISSKARYVDNFVPKQRLTTDPETIGLYHCDDGSGDKLLDSSGHNHHGKIVGAKWVRSDEPVQDAISSSGQWSPLTPLPQPVNSTTFEIRPDLTSDGLTMAFIRLHQVYITNRESTDADFEKPELVDTSSAGKEWSFTAPTISGDGRELVCVGFSPKDEPDVQKQVQDLFIMSRPDRQAPFSPPVALGMDINTAARETAPELSEDGRGYFSVGFTLTAGLTFCSHRANRSLDLLVRRRR